MRHTCKSPSLKSILAGVAVACILSLLGFSLLMRSRGKTTPTASAENSGSRASREAEVKDAYGRLPLSFEVNRGQTDSNVKYIARGSGYSLFLTPDEAVLSLSTASSSPSIEESDDLTRKTLRGSTVKEAPTGARSVLTMKVLGANAGATVLGQDQLPGKSNYFIGKDSKKWHTGISNFASVKYQGIYPGIDLVYYGNQRQLEYDFIIQPGTDPKQIALGFEGAEQINVSDAGDLVLTVSGREVRQQKPYAYQEVDGTRQEVPSRYALVSANRVEFELGNYDVTKPVVIDPVLVYSSYFGGTGFDTAPSVVVNSNGEAFFTGTTASINFPGLPIQKVTPDVTDAFVVKLNAAGTAIAYASYFGGDNYDFAMDVATDANGNAYITGTTHSSNFPMAGSPFQSAKSGGNPLFKSSDGGANFGAGVASGNSSGLTTANVSSIAVHPTNPSIVFATPFTGSSVYKSIDGGSTWSFSGIGLPDDFMNDIAFDRANPNVMYAAAAGTSLLGGGGGIYRSTDGTGNNWQLTSVTAAMNTVISDASGVIYAGGFDGRGVWKSVDGIVWSNVVIGDVEADTFADGFGFAVTNILVDPTNSSIVYASTNGGGIWKSFDGGASFVQVLNAPGYVSDHSLSIDSVNTLYAVVNGQLQKGVSGGATWTVLPTPVTAGSYPTSTLVAGSTLYLGTTQNGVFSSTDGGANWSTTSLTANDIHSLVDAPSAPNQIYAAVLTGSDAFVAKLSADGSSLVYSTYLGGGRAGEQFTADENALGIVVDSSGNAYVTGWTSAANFPLQNPTQGTLGGFIDAYVAKLNASGSALLFSTYIGGFNNDISRGIALGPSGDIYVTGNTTGGNFPVLNASQGSYGGGSNDAFVVRLSPSGPAYTRAYSTYLGGPNNDLGRGVAVDSSGSAYIAGQTNSSTGIATAGSAQATKAGQLDGFLVKLNSAAAKVYGTYIGGTSSAGGAASQDLANAVEVDASGNAYVVGWTRADGFPTANSIKTFNTTMCGALPCAEAFVTMINPSGSARIFSTLVGGDGEDQAFGIARDSAGAFYIAGFSSSIELKSGAPQSSNAGGGDAFITKLGPSNDLSITMTDSPDPVSINSPLTYTVTVTNSGEGNLTGITVSDTLPADSTFVLANATLGSWTPTSGSVSWTISSLGPGQSANIAIQVTPTKEGTISNVASAICTESETNTGNNAATQDTRVTVGNNYTVNSTADTDDGACTAVGTGNGCTLREALNAANANAGKDTILFNIAGAGAHTISPSSSLPVINHGVFIDGTSQPGFAGAPIIEINGSAAGQTNGFYILGGNSHLKGLVINGFFYGGINLKGGNHVVEGNYVGTNLAGTGAVPNTTGINIDDGANDLIGGTTIAARNVLSGNNGSGISINGAASGTRVQGNYIGLNASGTGPLTQPNWTPGVGVYSTSGAVIGGTTPGAGNVISGNKGPGIFISNNAHLNLPGAANNFVQGNFIGTTPNGLGAMINEGGGITVNAGSSNNLIGGATAAARNIIANGISLDTNSNANTIQGNYIGIKADGSARIISTGWAGIQLRGCSGNTIAGNVISGNAGPGIWIVNTCTECNPSQPFVASTNNVVQGNIIGLNPAGTAAIPNTNNGIGLERGSTGNLIGGTTAGARNIISGNTGTGININNYEAPANGNTIQGNYIGTNAAGNAAIGNNGNGIGLNGVSNTIIGGTAPGAGNVISGNLSSGITVGAGSPGGAQPLVGSTGTQILGNFIGTNATGTAVVRNTFGGVSVNGLSSNNHIGGTVAGSRNIITGNGGTGVDLNNFNGPAVGNFVEGNYIGTDVTGMSALSTVVSGSPFYGNGSGVGMNGSSNNKIGGTTAAERNVISGNQCQGVPIYNATSNTGFSQASNNTVQGNYIGLNKDGTALVTDPNGGAAFGNKCSGVFLGGSTNNLIGGTTPGAGNVIGGSAHQGVVISNNNNVVGSGNTIQGNLIGSNLAMTTALPNGIGVLLNNGASNNTVGGDDDDDGSLDGAVNAGNKIFGSTGDGINIGSAAGLIATGNKIQGNLIGGSATLRNGNNGVNLNGALNTIVGGTTAGAGNTISFNNNNGVVLNCPVLNGSPVCSVGTAIQRNSIFSHPNNLGIRFNSSGVNFGNNNQVSPTLSFAGAGSGTIAQGTLNTGVANQTYTLEFFSNNSCSPSGQGEGQTYIGTSAITTDASGNSSFDVSTLDAVPVGKIITATATHTTNGTSRFSACVGVSPSTANVSGRVTDYQGNPISGVTITLSGGQSASFTTLANGEYSFPNLSSSSPYTLTASLAGMTFYPATLTLANLPGDRTVNFTRAVTRYTLTDLGAAVPQAANSIGWDVNDSGTVTGWAYTQSANSYRPFVYSSGTMTSLGTLGTGPSALGIAINNSGRVVGYSEIAPGANGLLTGTLHGFFVDGTGALKDIGTLGGAASQAWNVNDSGAIVGQAQLSNGQTRPFLWRDANNDGLWQQSEMTDLGAFNGGTFGRGFAISNNGIVVGNSANGVNGPQVATLWRDDNNNGLADAGELRSLGNLGGVNSQASGVNDAMYVVGFSDLTALATNGRQQQRAFLWHDDNSNGQGNAGEMMNLGTLGGEFSAALRINAANDIVGWADQVGINTPHAFIYRNNFMADLNALIPADPNWVLMDARGLSEDGKISGYGLYNGQQRAFLLTPSLTEGQTVTLDAIPNKTYGNAPFTVHATASSNLPVTYSVTGPATINGSTVTITGAGTIIVTANQAGDSTYSPASASQSITVAKKALSVTADGKTRLFGAPDPTFTASYFGFVNGDTAASLGGSLSFTTNANATSNVGSYSITPAGLSSNNYAFNYLAGTLTIDKASTTTASSNYDLAVPGSVNLVAQITADSPSNQAVNAGTVTFTIRQGATTIATVTSGQVSGGSATASYAVASSGAYTVYVSYGGTVNYFGSTSLASLTVGNVNPVPSISGVTPDSAVKKVTETGQFTLLIDGNGFMSTSNGDPANSTVDWYDRTTGLHTNLSLTSINAAQIQAVVPYTLIRDGKTVEISVNNAGPGGGTSNVQPFFVTDTTATVTSSETVIPDPATGTASTTSVTPSGALLTAEASSGGTAGTGTLTVAQYSDDPIGTNASPNTSAFSTAEGSGYFDVYVAPGSSFTTLSLDYCNTGGTTLYWWDGFVWALVSNQSYNPGTGCITVNLTTTSSPSIAQLTGTVFGVASGPAINLITVTPSSAISLGSGPVTLNASFTDPAGSGPYTTEITWGDGQATNLTNVTGASITSQHTYASAGIYAVRVKVSRGQVFGTSTYSSVVVYDPNVGSLKGSGWISSPLGAFPTDPSFKDKVHFDSDVIFDAVSHRPTGKTQVKLPQATFNATSFSWLSITGAQVQVSGVGTINGAGQYGFLLTGFDGKLNGTKSPDKVRIKIWDVTTGQLIYDNQMSAPDSAAPIIVLGGGNVNIQKK